MQMVKKASTASGSRPILASKNSWRFLQQLYVHVMTDLIMA
jgi:hypothetical protein